jgi:hypothetical protein
MYELDARKFSERPLLALKGYPFVEFQPIFIVRFVPTKSMLVLVDLAGRMTLYSLISKQFRYFRALLAFITSHNIFAGPPESILIPYRHTFNVWMMVRASSLVLKHPNQVLHYEFIIPCHLEATNQDSCLKGGKTS